MFVSALPAYSQGSSSPVIGYYKFNVPPGPSIWVSGFVTKTDFQGAASSVTSGPATSTINRTGAAWTGFPNHYVEILEGSWAGLVLDIVSSTATSVTVEGNLGVAPGFSLPQTIKFAIRAHATLGKIFKSGVGLSAFEDEINLFYEDGSRKKFYFDDSVPGGQIVADDANSTNRDNEKVYPGQGMLFVTGGPRTLSFGGGEVSYVKQTATKVPLFGGQVNLVGLINPVVAAAPLVSTTATERAPINSPTLGLVSSSLSEYEDEISPYNLVGGVFSRQGIFYYASDVNTIVDLNGTPVNVDVPFGTGFVLRPAGDRYYTQPGVVVAN